MLPIPVTIVSGFLGAGKTTLINRILSADHGLSIAVIVNDVGDINVDAELLAGKSDGIVSLKNGCVCCSMRPDLVQHVGDLVSQQRPDHIVIEASGVSEPGNIVRALRYPELDETVFVSAVVTVIDAELFPELIGSARYLANEQLAEADIVLLNKSDLVSTDRLEQAVSECRLPGNFVHPCRFVDVPLSFLFYDSSSNRREGDRKDKPPTATPFDSRTWTPSTAIDLAALRNAIQALPPGVLRAKGFVNCSATGQTWLLQKVGRRINFRPLSVAHENALVLIGERGTVDWSKAFEILDDIALANDRRQSAPDPFSMGRGLRA